MSDLPRAVARMFGVGFDGASIPTDFQPLLARGVGSVILFRRNVESPRQVQQLCAQLKRSAPAELLICMDQEGGRVKRLGGGTFTDVPSARAIGRANDPALCEKIGGLLARELRAVNCDWDLAPVLDVDTNPKNPVIADRSFSSDPSVVARLGSAMIRGLQDGGVCACGKHFPGHGDTWQDTHHVLPNMDHSLERLLAVELPPFASAVGQGVATIMTSHIIFSRIDPQVPATMSHSILQGILRQRLGFDGLIVSDDLEMKAIADNYGIEGTLVRGATAGIDLFFICHNLKLQHEAIDLLIRAVERGDVPRQRIDDANRRIDAVYQKFYRPPVEDAGALEVIGCQAHQDLVRQIDLRATSAPDPTESWRKENSKAGAG
jgi:beta-N-acetylhexosaminidase